MPKFQCLRKLVAQPNRLENRLFLANVTMPVELFDAHEVSFVSVTQSFNTTSSMGRLTLNVLLSFAQFEREVIGRGFYALAFCLWRSAC
jgi:DNA invertase Pin-like site-specific DNA recombinase